ncbi:hypothetical protein RB6189 [Rhodopirellula baltica SH 1]|uniref:Uncharacterized protein n=1 Tax=Rhodopirellula baltica (strain DSM 10527 / NCIMB 13988 / SH1) TaxID=243090 RepID=Q7UQP3_RHOBA|nr:hypothetical protein RB6189 [Rhodopirellula baltica SH 1]
MVRIRSAAMIGPNDVSRLGVNLDCDTFGVGVLIVSSGLCLSSSR